MTRFKTNPLIEVSSSKTIGDNVNGPSVIKVPDWIKHPLGKYYMYFAHHSGKYIRLAYANKVKGPWKIYDPGTLNLGEATLFHDHIASPDVHVDGLNKRIIMYFHGSVKGVNGQKTGVATSDNGINFKAAAEVLGKFYFRVWKWDEWYYALAKNDNEGFGELYRSKDGLTNFIRLGNFLKDARHSAVHVSKNILYIFYSRVGDAPERIIMATVDMEKPWQQWEPSEPCEVLKPEEKYEGIDNPIMPSKFGSAIGVHQLRDPATFKEGEKLYLFYSIAGEEGIAGAEIVL